VLAKKLGWKIGDRVTLLSPIYPGDWEFRIVGIYTAKRKSVDRSSFWFRWDYLNESVPARAQEQVGWVAARIDDPGQAAQISKVIDAKFEERDIQTLTMSERALQVSFMGMFSAVLKALDVISIVILLIMTLILGNTIAMGVRERTHEYGTLRAIGFMPKHLAMFVMAEALTIGALGGAVGLGLSYPFINGGIGRFLEENMGGMFPYFRIETPTAVAAMALALAFAAAASAIPAYRVSRLKVTDALRRIG
jgi:putative ABC transport system permease protein